MLDGSYRAFIYNHFSRDFSWVGSFKREAPITLLYVVTTNPGPLQSGQASTYILAAGFMHLFNNTMLELQDFLETEQGKRQALDLLHLGGNATEAA